MTKNETKIITAILARKNRLLADALEQLKLLEVRLVLMIEIENELNRKCHVCKVRIGEMHRDYCSVGNDIFY